MRFRIGLLMLWIACTGGCRALGPREAFLATGIRVGEVTESSAIVWARATREPERNSDGLRLSGSPRDPLPDGVEVEQLEGSCPGVAAELRVRYGRLDRQQSGATEWVAVGESSDFSYQFRLQDLQPMSRYTVTAEVRGVGQEKITDTRQAQFRTSPKAQDRRPLRFTAMTCQHYGHLDHPEGFHIYPSMLALDPAFYLSIGDNVYYDADTPRATNPGIARHHWDRIFSLPRIVDFLSQVPGYWLKDDHDLLSDDCFPGMDPGMMAPLTFAQGQRIFLEQVPMGDRTYRTVRWGRGLQLWLVENRDFRSPNPMPDGPAKSIWGEQQKQWLRSSLLESDADWKILVSPNPMVGPDKPRKADNHANAAFAHEGMEFSLWAREALGDNFFVICGDRHWQYYSRHPETGLREFSCGPASDVHAVGSPGENEDYHLFHRMKGGFLSVELGWKGEDSSLTFRFHDVLGNEVYSFVAG